MSFFADVGKIIADNWDLLLKGVGNTMLIALVGTLAGLIIGLLIGISISLLFFKSSLKNSFKKCLYLVIRHQLVFPLRTYCNYHKQ